MFEYDPSFFEKRPIDRLNDNIIEGLKVSLIERFFDEIKFVGNPLNAHFVYLDFDCDQRFITRRRIYRLNENIIESLKIIPSLTYILIKCKKNKGLVQCIDLLTIKTVHVIMKRS